MLIRRFLSVNCFIFRLANNFEDFHCIACPQHAFLKLGSNGPQWYKLNEFFLVDRGLSNALNIYIVTIGVYAFSDYQRR